MSRLDDKKVFNEYLARLIESSSMFSVHSTTEWMRQLAKAERKLKETYIQQAERAEELEKDYELLMNDFHAKIKEGYAYQVENERYKQAIKKAIGGCRYTNQEVAYILSQALKGESE